MPPHTCESDVKLLKMPRVGEDGKKTGLLCTTGRDAEWGTTGRQFGVAYKVK